MDMKVTELPMKIEIATKLQTSDGGTVYLMYVTDMYEHRIPLKIKDDKAVFYLTRDMEFENVIEIFVYTDIRKDGEIPRKKINRVQIEVQSIFPWLFEYLPFEKLTFNSDVI